MHFAELEAFDRSAQGFPHCERGVLCSVRFGGLLLLRGFELPEPAVLDLADREPRARPQTTEVCECVYFMYIHCRMRSENRHRA